MTAEAPGSLWLVLGVPADGHRARAGRCLSCGATDRPVAWTGVIRLDDIAAPYTACEDCAAALGAYARAYAEERGR